MSLLSGARVYQCGEGSQVAPRALTPDEQEILRDHDMPFIIPVICTLGSSLVSLYVRRPTVNFKTEILDGKTITKRELVYKFSESLRKKCMILTACLIAGCLLDWWWYKSKRAQKQYVIKTVQKYCRHATILEGNKHFLLTLGGETFSFTKQDYTRLTIHEVKKSDPAHLVTLKQLESTYRSRPLIRHPSRQQPF